MRPAHRPATARSWSRLPARYGPEPQNRVWVISRSRPPRTTPRAGLGTRLPRSTRLCRIRPAHRPATARSWSRLPARYGPEPQNKVWVISRSRPPRTTTEIRSATAAEGRRDPPAHTQTAKVQLSNAQGASLRIAEPLTHCICTVRWEHDRQSTRSRVVAPDGLYDKGGRPTVACSRSRRPIRQGRLRVVCIIIASDGGC